MITFQKITGDNFRECIKLETYEEQNKFVAKNVTSLAQAYVSLVGGDCVPMPYAIYEGDVMVGFIMLSYNAPDPKIEGDETSYSIWRLMIDKRYQKMGYGRIAMEQALEYIRTFPMGEAKVVNLSYEPENSVAKQLYASLGFVEGEIDDGEQVAILRLL